MRRCAFTSPSYGIAAAIIVLYCAGTFAVAQSTPSILKLIRAESDTTDTHQGNVIYSVDNGNTSYAICDDGWSTTDATVVCKQLGQVHIMLLGKKYDVFTKIATSFPLVTRTYLRR
jgi:hypothetical protein